MTHRFPDFFFSNLNFLHCRMSALKLTVLAECSTSRARTALMELPHAIVETPVFMPVGTQGTLKGLLTEQLEKMDCRIMLGNTYHLGKRSVNFGNYLAIH